MAVGALLERQDRPALVRFERVSVEDKAETLKQGKLCYKDVDYALITPPYSKDVHRVKVVTWRDNMDADVRNERLPADWRDRYVEQYQRWQNGQEMPPNGTPIKGWPVISPAQQSMLIAMNILTVEDLAGVNDEGMRRIGMGSGDLKNKARAWLAQAQDKAPLTLENAALRAKCDNLEAEVATLKEIVAKLQQGTQQPQVVRQTDESPISADDILPETEPVKQKRK